MRRISMRAVRYVGVGLAALLLVVVVGVWLMLRASLPRIDGSLSIMGLRAAATIERDAAGVPTIHAASRADLAYATGFAHAQDRFFQMDLLRRAAAGELAELLGPAVVDSDRQLRVHGFTQVAARVLAEASDPERALLTAYASGVNAALQAARARPWEYQVLRSQPRAWQPADCLLVAFAMYLNLNDSTGAGDLARSRLHAALPPELFAFLHPLGTEWDAPMAGGVWRAPSIPGPEVLDLRRHGPEANPQSSARCRSACTRSIPLAIGMPPDEDGFVGSNSWAVAGTHTVNGTALLANDMHLGLRLPHLWYRAHLIVTGADARDLIGVTLPGLPMLVAGSNGKVAWGYTNSYGDWTDLVVVEADDERGGHYRVGAHSEPIKVRHETLRVRGEPSQQIDVRTTRWGPIVARDERGNELALAWTAHQSRASNIGMLAIETTVDVDSALDAANRAGGPVQNFVAADRQGRIGWSLFGQVPVRANYDSTLPASWRDVATGWIGWRSPQEYPRIVDAPSGRIWTANNRVLGAEEWLGFLGDGGPDNGARAGQIRDGLLALPKASAQDMLRIQLDDRALFLTRWRDLLLELLDEPAVALHPQRIAARAQLVRWSGRAAPQDVGYRIVRTFRLQLRDNVFRTLTAPARKRFPDAKFEPAPQFETSLWQLVTQQPAHLLDPHHASWRAALLSALDETLATMLSQCERLEQCTWGRQNTLAMRHPLSSSLPFASRWLDMPAVELPGDSAMPRVQGTAFGASQRMVIAPGHEAESFFQMPGSQVDHPLSPFYRTGHRAWVLGEPQPLLPGAPLHRLQLLPGH